MPQFFELNPINPQLSRYIDSYFVITGTGHVPAKQILPRPGASLMFDFNGLFYNGRGYYNTMLSGLQNEAYGSQSFADYTDRLVVRFSPYGLSRFIKIPLHELTNEALTPETVFGAAATHLYEQLANETHTIERLQLIEQFLIQRITSPSITDVGIFTLADTLKSSMTTNGLNDLKSALPLSIRQVERKFKTLVGVDIQTYLRICRFDYSKKLMFKSQQAVQLTQVAYKANYYDQAHFSNEFKKIVGVSPQRYIACADGHKDDKP